MSTVKLFKLGDHPGVLGLADPFIQNLFKEPSPNFGTYRLIGLLKSFPLKSELDRDAMEFIINMILFQILEILKMSCHHLNRLDRPRVKNRNHIDHVHHVNVKHGKINKNNLFIILSTNCY
jgi:hypothetical protein